MVIIAKLQCKNNEDFFFSGKEMSPLGIGYCAETEPVGEQMIGRDGKCWVVAVKNGEKAWVRSPEKIGLEKEEPRSKKSLPPKNPLDTPEDYNEGDEYIHENVTYIIKIVKNNKKWYKKTEDSSTTKPKAKRGPTKYNIFIGKTLTRLREEEPGLKTTEYMKKALEIWNGLTVEEKANLT
jgi:hypothetical protein